jgi:hypothetical protein
MAVREQQTFQRRMGGRLLGNELHRSTDGHGKQQNQSLQGNAPYSACSTVIQTDAGNKLAIVLR